MPSVPALSHIIRCILFATWWDLVIGHYTFSRLYFNNSLSEEWEYVRPTANYYDYGPVTDINSPSLRCYENNTASASMTGVATVKAGNTVGFRANLLMSHPGGYDQYFSAYLSKANPSSNSSQAGLEKTWFKIWEWSPSWNPSSGELVFNSLNIWQFNFTIPKDVPSGHYLLRGEQIALHLAASEGGAQFYVGCAQINVVNGGKGSPSPTVRIPGLYRANDSGITLNIQAPPKGYKGYTAPGPAVWSG